jgi:hypothetical protein
VGETDTVPDVPEAVKPDPVQEVAFVDDHERVDELPEVMDVEDAERIAVGGVGWSVESCVSGRVGTDVPPPPPPPMPRPPPPTPRIGIPMGFGIGTLLPPPEEFGVGF